jgi:RHS repeat-associated protein
LTTKTVADGVENAQSFFHTDHLGSSGYVTDGTGAVTEHLEYFAFGETWVEERAGQADTPYQFTGKELDAETGLYYHGARYYNPRTQLWASADPALPDYLDSDAAGGINEPRNLASYTYTHNNPLRYTDPTGELLQLAPLAPATPFLATPAGAAVVGTIVIGAMVYAILNSHTPDDSTVNSPRAAQPGPVPQPPPAPGTKTDNEEMVSIYKAPQPGMGDKFMSRGFLKEDFPSGDDNNGYAYFAGPNDRALAEEYARSYREGVIEIRIPKSDYDLIWKRFEKRYQGGPQMELEIPADTVTALNAYRPWILRPSW